jgi:hypothetical protein
MPHRSPSPLMGEGGAERWLKGSAEAKGAAARMLRAATSLLVFCFIPPAFAAPVANPVANFSGLDKITARITHFDVYLNETVQFGSLQITPRVCYTRSADEAQRTSVFVEVDQVNLKGATERIFTGWMFADSPALNAIDDAVYDFWLVDCKQHSNVPPPAKDALSSSPPAQAEPTPAASTTPPPANGDGGIEVPTRIENGSIITLLSPNRAAETSPDGQ